MKLINTLSRSLTSPGRPVKFEPGVETDASGLDTGQINWLLGRGCRIVGDKTPQSAAPPPEPPEESLPESEYASWSIAELKDEARDRGIQGYYKMNKAALVEALERNDAE